MRTRLYVSAFSVAIVCAGVFAAPRSVKAETPEEWIALGRRVHGGFGTFIPLGIRIGLDAVKRLDAKPRELAVTYYDSDKSPCACFLDGVMIASTASPGQRSVVVAGEKAPEGFAAVIVIQHRKTGAAIKYAVPQEVLLRLAQWNRTLDERGRFDEVMKADGLFTSEVVK